MLKETRELRGIAGQSSNNLYTRAMKDEDEAIGVAFCLLSASMSRVLDDLEV